MEQQINFYKEGNLWIIDDVITPSGSYRMKNYKNGIVSIFDLNSKQIFKGEVIKIKII